MAGLKYLTDSGVIVPDTADLRAEVEAEFRQALGPDINLDPSTPQGMLVTAEVLARDNVLRFCAAVANQINPNLAGGKFLDAIWALTRGERVRATFSTVSEVTLTGQPGAIIPQGARASVGPGGAQFELVRGVQIPSSGVASGDFRAVDPGPVLCPAGGLDTIQTPVLGWFSVSNPTAATPGQAEESDQAARARRRKTLGLQGVALPESILSAVYNVNGVRSALLRENVTPDPIVIDDVTLAPHSIYVCVDGGLDYEVAQALLARKSLGCGWNGETTVLVNDPYSGQEYAVRFQRPDLVPIYAQVTVRADLAGGDPAQAVREAIIAYAEGRIEGDEGFTVGRAVSPFELSAAVAQSVPGVFVSDVKISDDNVTFSAEQIPLTIRQRASILPGDIQVMLA